MANQYGIDLGAVYRDQEALEAAKVRNATSKLQLGEMEREIKERPIKEAAANERKNLLTNLRTEAAGGSQEAKTQLMVLDAKGQNEFLTAIGKQSDEQKTKTQENIKELAKMSAWVLNSKDDAEAEKNLNYVFSKLPDEQKESAIADFQSSGLSPKQYAQFNIQKTADMNALLKNPQKVSIGGEDRLYKDGQLVDSAATPNKSAGPLVSVNTGGDKKESEKLAELRVKRLDEIQQKAIQAEEQIESINQIKAIDLDTGLGVETRGQIAKVWDSLGGDGAALTGVDPSDVQKFKSVAMKQVLDIMASQKGPQTDQDAARIEKATANLGNTKEANSFIMDSAIAIANRKIEQAEFMEKFLEENNTMKGADGAWREFKSKTPMVSDVVKNPSTGAPIFFYQFNEKMKSKNYSESDIVEAWREMNSRGK